MVSLLPLTICYYFHSAESFSHQSKSMYFFLEAVISHLPSALFFVVFKSLSRCINVILNSIKFSISSFFLGSYSLSTSSLGCKALFIVITFHVLSCICFSSSHIPVINDSEYLRRRQPKWLSLL